MSKFKVDWLSRILMVGITIFTNRVKCINIELGENQG